MKNVVPISEQKPNSVFKFQPLDFVYINLYGVKLEGRIHRCIIGSGKMPFYDVDFMDHGVFNMRECYEDELEAKKK